MVAFPFLQSSNSFEHELLGSRSSFVVFNASIIIEFQAHSAGSFSLFIAFSLLRARLAIAVGVALIFQLVSLLAPTAHFGLVQFKVFQSGRTEDSRTYKIAKHSAGKFVKAVEEKEHNHDA